MGGKGGGSGGGGDDGAATESSEGDGGRASTSLDRGRQLGTSQPIRSSSGGGGGCGLDPVYINVVVAVGSAAGTLDVHGAAMRPGELPAFESTPAEVRVTSHCWGRGGALWLGDAAGRVHTCVEAVALPARAAAEATGVTRADGTSPMQYYSAASLATGLATEGAVFAATTMDLDVDLGGESMGGGAVTGLAFTTKGLVVASSSGRVAWIDYIAHGGGDERVWGVIVESVHVGEGREGTDGGSGGVSALAVSPSFKQLAVGLSSGALASCPAWIPIALAAANAEAEAAAAASELLAATAAAGAMEAVAEASMNSSIGAPSGTLTGGEDECGVGAQLARSRPVDLLRWVTRGHGGAVNAVVPLPSLATGAAAATTSTLTSSFARGSRGASFATACADGVLRLWATAGGSVELVAAFDAGGRSVGGHARKEGRCGGGQSTAGTALTAAAALPSGGSGHERGYALVVGTVSGAVSLVTGLAAEEEGKGGSGGGSGSGDEGGGCRGLLSFTARLHEGAVAAVAVAATAPDGAGGAGGKYVATLGADDGRVVFLATTSGDAGAGCDTLVPLGYVRCRKFGNPRAIAWTSGGDGCPALIVSIENGDVVRLTPPPVPPHLRDVVAATRSQQKVSPYPKHETSNLWTLPLRPSLLKPQTSDL